MELHQLQMRQPVAESRIGRLRQMRAISRRFSVQKTDRESVSRELRLLPQPVYRYPHENVRVLDGTLFAFVQGTRPETLLLIVARQSEDGKVWDFGLARMNSVQFVAKYEDREVWRVETWPWSKAKNGQEAYTVFGPFDRPIGNE